MVRPNFYTTEDPSRKRSSNRRNVKTAALRFNVDENILKKQLFENDSDRAIMRFLAQNFHLRQIQSGW